MGPPVWSIGPPVIAWLSCWSIGRSTGRPVGGNGGIVTTMSSLSTLFAASYTNSVSVCVPDASPIVVVGVVTSASVTEARFHT